MPVEAKISSDLSGVRIAPVQAVEGSVSVAPGSSIALNVAPEAVTGFSREGTDLLVHLRTGETVRIANFYVDPSRFSQLMLVEEDHLVAADVAQLSGSSLATPAYVPMDVIAGFAAPPATEAAGMVAGAASGAGLGAGVIVPLAVLGGGGLIAVAAGGGGGNRGGNDTPTTPPDTTAPAAPSNLVVSAAGDRLTGRAEAGATVLVDTDGDGTANYTSIVGADGAFTVVLAPALVNAEPISVTVRDAAGNVGPAAGTNAPDLTPPENATQLGVAADGTGITGTGEPGATVTIDIDGDGELDYTATIAADGTFSVLFAAPVDNGQPITVRVTDAAGNMSDAATVRAPDLTPPPATAPTIAPSNGTALTGTAGSGVAVMLTDAAGHTVGQATIAADGTWSFTPQPPLTNGTEIRVAAVNLEGQAGPAASITIDSLAPDAPTLSPSNGTEIGGAAEAGTTILVTDGSGTPLGQAVAGTDGAWSMTPANPVPDGTILIAIARDAAGNSSPPTSTTVDAMAPPAPTLAPPNATTVSGTAEPGATLILSDGNGDPIGETSADSDGNWTFTPSPPLADGSTVVVAARDAAGNVGPSTSAAVDATAPAAPDIAPSKGDVISGTGELGATVILTDGSGNSLGQTVVGTGGTWTFTPGSPLPDGTSVNAVARDAAGNESASDSIVIDAVSPAAPEIAPTNGTVISGTSEPGALILLTAGNGDPIGQTLAEADGNWSFVPGPSLADGTGVSATAQDAAGNASPASTTTVDAIAPDAPSIDSTDGNALTGTAEPNTVVTLTDGDGNPIGDTSADGGGNWSFTPGARLSDGTVVTATARDAAGNVSPASTTTVDSTAPADPTIDPTNGSLVTGTAEPNSTVVLMDGTGNIFAAFSPQASPGGFTVFAASSAVPDYGLPLGQVTTDPQGNWTFTPAPLPDGTVVIAVSVDAAGNVSGPVSTTVDGVPPAIPTIDPTTGALLEGNAEPGVTLLLSDSLGNPIGETTADDNGDWTFVPTLALPHDTVVEVVAVDAAGNISLPASTVVDAVAPVAPIIAASSGDVLTGTAEPGTTIILTDGLGIPLGEAIVDQNGGWIFTPSTPLPDSTVVEAFAIDAAGNISPVSTVTIDATAPDSPVLTLVSGGELLLISAEPGVTVRVVIDGETANPIQVTVDGNGNFSLPLLTPLIANETVSAIAIDAAGNQSLPTVLIAPDIAPLTIAVVEADDGYINANEAADGIQVEVTLRPTMQAGQQITAALNGQGGYQAQATHVLSVGDILAGVVVLTIAPAGGFPEGASSVSASIGGGDGASPVNFVIDTSPATPVLSLLASALTISGEPGSQLTVTATVGGLTTNTVVTADNSGLASLNLLTDLGVRLDWAQLLDARISVTSEDPAGNTSSVATIDIAPNIQAPPTIGGFGLAVSLNPLNPQFGISGTTEPNSTVAIRVVTPVLNVELLPLTADGSGHFTLNLLSPAILTQLGLNVTDILNLGSQISLGMVATDPQGHESAIYGLSLSPNGLSLNLGQIDVNGSLADDIMSGTTGAEHINGNSGNDLVLNVGAGDHVLTGPGHDTVEVLATNFSTIDGGAGFDTILLGNGIDLDYGAPGVGTLSNIERIDLGTGDSGSVLTLTASEVSAITDAGHTLQITGESNDVLNITGAVDTGSTQTLDGLVYDVYTFGVSTILVEDNTVQVVV